MSNGGYIWACFGGTELWNQCATVNYQANGHGFQDGSQCRDCAPCCADFNAAMYGGVGGPNIAQAPWYDPNEPFSTEFAGLLITSIEGLLPGAFTRPVSESVGTGATLGQARQLAPVITVTGILVGSCCGVDYGLSWLASVLRGSCDPTKLCAGETFQFLSCEPMTPDFDCLTPAQVAAFDYDAWITPYLRTFQNVALISGPEISNRISHGCPQCDETCPYLEVTFTLSAGDPHVYREAVEIISLGVFEDDPENLECIEWVKSGSGLTCGCASPPNCSTDPLCQDISPPSMPQLTSTCIRGCLQHDRVRSCFTIPAGLFPANGSGTLQIEIFSGDAAMRNIFIEGWENPLGFAPEDLDDCNACFGLSASYVAADSTLVIDGSTKTSMITCAGGTSVRANPFIAGNNDSPLFSYPDFAGCRGPYTVCIYADSPVSARASIKVTAIGYEG